MAVLTHLNPPCWKWIWHMRNEDFGPYSCAPESRTPTGSWRSKTFPQTPPERVNLNVDYLRLNMVSFEIERRSNGSLEIKSIVRELESLWGRTRKKNIACYINVIFSTTFSARASSNRKCFYRQNRKCGRSTFVLCINKVTLFVGPFHQLSRRSFCIFLTVTNNLQMFLTRKKRLYADIRAQKHETVSDTSTIT